MEKEREGIGRTQESISEYDWEEIAQVEAMGNFRGLKTVALCSVTRLEPSRVHNRAALKELCEIAR